MKREIKERTILDKFAGDFVDIDENEITKIKAQIRRLRLS
jgi:hypothetical protein